MRSLFLLVSLSIAGAACNGSSSAAPSAIPLSIAGEWSGNVTIQDGDFAHGAVSWATVSGQASIAQSNGSATGQLTMPGRSATFTGTVEGNSFDGSARVSDREGCAVDVRLSGSVSERRLLWSTAPPDPACGWITRFTFDLSRP